MRRALCGVAACLLVITAAATGPAAGASDRSGSGGDNQDPPVPQPTDEQRIAVDVPGVRLGGTRLTALGSTHERYVVLVEDQHALGAAISATGVAPVEVWRTGLFGFAAELGPAQVTALRQMPGVAAVEPDQIIEASADQVDPPWGLDRIDQRNRPLNANYRYARTGAGVTAYVIDSGLWFSHTEFTGRVPTSAYWNFGDGTEAWDCDGHGTHVAGTVGGTTYGVAKQVSIIPVKVLDCEGTGPTSAVLAGIDWVIAHHPPGVPAVANMSIGGPGSLSVDAAVGALIADGVTVVAAAGNEASQSCNASPARVPAAITVAASDADDARAAFSNVGSCNDLYAPGVGILSAFPSPDDVGSAVGSGTSQASPHVAGAAALVLQGAPTATPAQVWSILDTLSTKGVMSECCGDPDKLLYVPPDGAFAPPPPPPPLPVADLVTVRPFRLYDSREVDGPRPAGWVTAVQVTGRGGVPAGAPMAALNVTVVEPSEAGFMTVFPCGAIVPEASNLNYRAGQTIPNAAVVKLDGAGRVCVFSSATAGLLVDVNGYTPAASDVVPLVPARLYDSRSGAGVRGAASVTEVLVAGVRGVPADAAAVLLNVTAVEAQADGFMTVFPCGTRIPVASNLNYRTGQTIANAVLGRLGAGGKVCVYTDAAAHLIVDVNAAVPATSTIAAVDPVRLYDTRTGPGPAGAGSITSVQVAGRGGVPSGAVTAVLNVTALEPGDVGFVTVFPCDAGLPVASNLNYAAGDTIPNAVVAKLSSAGTVCLYTYAGAGLIVDVNGYAT